MEFIAGGVELDDGKREAGLVPAPISAFVALRLADGAPREHGEDGEFGQVAAFAESVMKLLNMRLRHGREQPAHERFKINGGVARGISVA